MNYSGRNWEGRRKKWFATPIMSVSWLKTSHYDPMGGILTKRGVVPISCGKLSLLGQNKNILQEAFLLKISMWRSEIMKITICLGTETFSTLPSQQPRLLVGTKQNFNITDLELDLIWIILGNVILNFSTVEIGPTRSTFLCLLLDWEKKNMITCVYEAKVVIEL